MPERGAGGEGCGGCWGWTPEHVSAQEFDLPCLAGCPAEPSPVPLFLLLLRKLPNVISGITQETKASKEYQGSDAFNMARYKSLTSDIPVLFMPLTLMQRQLLEI